MTDEEEKALIILTTEFKGFLERYGNDQSRAQGWREKFEKKLDEDVIRPLHYGNGKPSLFTRVDRIEQIVKRVGAGIAVIAGLVGAWMGLK